MAKDPAALFYIDKWLIATKEMKADCRGWFLNLVMHQYDKKDLPNDIEELANLADVRFSEFKQFEQVFEQVLQHKFELNSNNRFENAFAREIIQCRKKFLDKRSEAGKISYLKKFALKTLKLNIKQFEFIKYNIDFDSVDMKNEQVFKQVIEQILELYINTNKDVDENKGIDSKREDFELKVNTFIEFSQEMRDAFIEYWTEKNDNGKLMKFEKQDTFNIKGRLARWKKNDFTSQKNTGRTLNDYEQGASSKYANL